LLLGRVGVALIKRRLSLLILFIIFDRFVWSFLNYSLKTNLRIYKVMFQLPTIWHVDKKKRFPWLVRKYFFKYGKVQLRHNDTDCRCYEGFDITRHFPCVYTTRSKFRHVSIYIETKQAE
jgi:hypothetical protein